MGLFKRIENLDKAINLGYARWGKWIWAALVVPFIVYCAYIVWAAVWGPPTGPVTLIIHNELDRPILGFSVNGMAGANASARNRSNPYAFDSGKTTCCGAVSGDTAKVVWTLDMTHEQYLKGMRLEKRKVDMKLPKREWGENYLHVYFLPKDKVGLWWSTGFNHPKPEGLPEINLSENKMD
ncbi:hypothetical protein ACLBW0_04775 [Enterobacteriaceae bacterium C34A]